jgi:hypothetical protein
MNLTFICVQPCISYYAWQVEVMLKNFVECGIEKKYPIHCLFAYNANETDWRDKVDFVKKVQKKYESYTNIQFHYYQDTRVYPYAYISSIRPNLLKQHFKKLPYLNMEAVFYHDCDIIFTKFPDFLEPLCVDDNTWYVSDTKSYISHNYIIGKGDAILQKMCEIIGIHPSLVKQKEAESGGAQYLLKGVDWRFFEKMEKDCEKLYKDISALNNDIKHRISNISLLWVGKEYPKESNARKLVYDEILAECNKNLSAIDVKIKEIEVHTELGYKITKINYHELQIWCSDMWAILWGAWMRGYDTKVIPEMNFCWATDQAPRWHEVYIYHNAGVTAKDKEKMFFKGNFINELPFLEEGHTYDRNLAAFKYFSIVKSIGKDSCLIENKVDNDFFKLHTINRAYNRFMVCKACENFQPESNTCKLCGCQTEKTILQDENKCPDKKWSI